MKHRRHRRHQHHTTRTTRVGTRARMALGLLALASLALVFVSSDVVRATARGTPGKIAFVSHRDGNGEIYVINPDGTGETRLTNTSAEEEAPAWSPDGRKIAFASNAPGNFDIYVMSADGSGAVNLSNHPANDRAPRWSPDRSKLVFVSDRDGDSEIYVMNADGTGVTQLTTNEAIDTHPDWSPDGAGIVFATDRDGVQHVYVMNADGSNQHSVYDGEGVDTSLDPDWGPDGTSIALTTGSGTSREVRLINLDDPDYHVNISDAPAADDFSISWRPDDDGVVFSSNRGGNYGLCIVTGTDFDCITNSGDTQPNWQPLPTAGDLVFIQDVAGYNQIHVMGADGTNPTAVTSGASNNIEPAWSPDRSKIAFTSDRTGSADVFVMDGNGSNQVNLTNLPSADDDHAAWSPDGTRIAFHSTRDGGDDVWVMNADGSNPINLTNSPGVDTQPAWSRDGSRIAFVSFRDGDAEIYVMNANGTNPQRSTNSPGTDEHPAWSPDSARIVFGSTRTGGGDLYVMNASGTGPLQLTSDATNDTWPSWSGDGRRIAFQRDQQIYVIDADGLNQQPLGSTASAASPDWGFPPFYVVVPTVTWPVPPNIVVGEPLTAAQLNATANVPGTFVYSPAEGAILPAGVQTLGVTFTPTDTANFQAVFKTNGVVVQPLTAANDSYSMAPGDTLTVPQPGLLTNDTYPAGAAPTVELTTTPAGTLTDLGGGAFSYTPVAGFTGTVAFDYVFHIAGDDSTTATVSILVDGSMLPPGATITGRVTNAASGDPVQGVFVGYYDGAGNSLGGAPTGLDGVYSLAVQPGAYRLATTNDLNYIDERYDNHECVGPCSVSTGDLVNVTAGNTLSGIDFALRPGGSITGHVTGPQGQSLQDIQLRLYGGTDSTLVTTVFTDASGNYRFDNLPDGDYHVRTFNTTGYSDEVWDNTFCIGTCDVVLLGAPISVTAGVTTAHIDFSLALGGGISGVVTDAVTHQPLSGVDVNVHDVNDNFLIGVISDTDGTYSFNGLPPDLYRVQTNNSQGYVDKRYENVSCPAGACLSGSGTPIDVLEGSTTENIDFDLAVGGHITGRLTNEATGDGLAGLSVSLYDDSGSYSGEVLTGLDGYYDIGGLPTGVYHIAAFNDGYSREIYDNVACIGACTATAGTPVSVIAPATTPGIDMALTPNGIIAGTVTDYATGSPFSGVTVVAYNGMGQMVDFSSPDVLGHYQLDVPPGTSFVRTFAANHLDEVYDDITCIGMCVITNGTPINVSSGVTTSGIDFVLSEGDITSPVILNLVDVHWEATSPGGAIVNYTMPTAIDNVDGTVPVTCAPASGTQFPIGSTPVSCSAEDAVGNSTAAGFAVIVGDTLAPVISDVPANVTLEATSPFGTVATFATPTALDSLDGIRPVSCLPESGSTFGFGPTPVFCTAADLSGNTTGAGFTVFVQDTTLPVLQNVPADITAEASTVNGAVVTYVDPTATDNADGPVAAACAPASGSVFPIGSTVVSCSATDAHLNTVLSTFAVTVGDSTGPSFSTPLDIVVEANSVNGADVVTFSTPTAIDAIDGPLTVTCAPESGTAFPLGATLVSCSATDARGNTGGASFTVLVQDTTAPTITIATPPDGAFYSLGIPMAALYSCSDAVDVASCSGPVANGEDFDTFTTGPHSFTVTASDSAGNVRVATSNYTVLEPPRVVVTSPVEPLVELNSVVLAEFTCTGATSCEATYDDGTVIPNGTPLRTTTSGANFFTVTATDVIGNTTSEIVLYKVSIGACVVPPAGVTAWLAGDGTAQDEVTGASATWTGTPTYVQGKVAQAFQVGEGNSLTLPLTQTGPLTLQFWTRTSDRLQAAGTGVVATGTLSGTSLQVGLDGSGNYELQVGDNELTLLIGPATDYYQHIAVTYDGTNIAVYLNGDPVQTVEWTGSPDLGVQGQLTLGWDRAGLLPYSGVIDELQVVDHALSADEVLQAVLAGISGWCKNQTPVAVAVASPNPAEATSAAGALVTLDATGSTDADNDTLTATWSEGSTVLGTGLTLDTQLSLGTHIISVLVDDGHFNSATTDVTVLVRDAVGPVFDATPDVVAEATGPDGAVVTFITPTAIDAVDGPVAVACDPASGGLFPLGSTLVTCSATDAAGNPASAGFNVVVHDTTAPDFANVPADITVEATSAAGAVVTFAPPSAVDIVDGSLPVTCTPPSGSTFQLGLAVVSCSATDAAGNIGTRTFNVTVVDTTAPALNDVPANITAEATASGGAIVNFASATATDAVDAAPVVTSSPATGAQFALGTTTVTVTATDAAGNASEQTFDVTVVDTTPPSIAIASPPDGAMYPLGMPVQAAFSCTDAVGVATCAGPVLNGEDIDTFTAGVHAFTVTATDAAGNLSIATTTYTVLEPPRITVTSPLEPVVELNSLVLAQYTCGGGATSCTAEYEDGTPIPAGAPLRTTTTGLVSFMVTATDAVGNSAVEVVVYKVSIGACVPPASDVIAWLGGDNTTQDEITGAFASWAGTAQYAPGKVGQAFAVGNGHSVTFPLAQPATGAFTVQMWARTPDRAQAIGSEILTTSPVAASAVRFAIDGDGNYELRVGDNELNLLIGPATDYFQHLAATYDGTDLAVYLNGDLVQLMPWSGSQTLAAEELALGLGTGEFVVDEVQAASRALTSDDVMAVVLAGTSGWCKNQTPVASALASPNPAEATSAAGALVTLDATGSTDADNDTLTATWSENGNPLGTGLTLATTLSLGTHLITVEVNDGHFNTATADVTVVVRDTAGPVLAGVPAEITVEATGPNGAEVSYASPDALDAVDGVVAVTCGPASGTTFALGTTPVNCSATDAAGNVSPTAFNVNVRDTIAPAVNDVPANLTAEATSASGAAVSWLSPTALDVVDGTLPVMCAPSSGSTFAFGATLVTCTATDAAGNTGNGAFTVTVVDTTAPAFDDLPMVTAEATSAAGAAVSWNAIQASDAVDGQVTAVCAPASGSVFALGTTPVDCTATDARGNASHASFDVTVVDTTAPALSLPPDIVEEAYSPAGAPATWSISAIDLVDGTVGYSCTVSNGSLFPLGTTVVSCTTTDSRGNVAGGAFSVTVQDTTAPSGLVTTPTTDEVYIGTTTAMAMVSATDAVGVDAVVINGVAATKVRGTFQSGSWTATVPVTTPSAGGALVFDVTVTDAAGNTGTASRLVDSDGISAVIDRSRVANVNQSEIFSSEFNNSTTAGTVTRNGWTVKVSNGPVVGGVRAMVTGTGSIARVAACTGAAKEVRFDAPGETADISCNLATGTITVKAISAIPVIEVWKQQSNNTWTSAQLRAGASYSTGSPATAGDANTVPINVNIVQFDPAGAPMVVGSFTLAPGASMDVQVRPGSAQNDEIQFNVLKGRVPVRLRGVMRMVETGAPVTMAIEREVPRVSLTRPASGERVLSGQPFDIQWTVGRVPVASVDVAFSADGGVTYEAIPGCSGLRADVTSCTWSAPGPITTQARVRITAHDVTGKSVDIDSDMFTVATQETPVAVAAPAATREWAIGSVQSIGWRFVQASSGTRASTATGTAAGAATDTAITAMPVNIDISRDEGVTWDEVAFGVASSADGTGAFEWEVTGPAVGTARIRVRPSGSPDNADAGEVSVSIVDPLTSASGDVAAAAGK